MARPAPARSCSKSANGAGLGCRRLAEGAVVPACRLVTAGIEGMPSVHDAGGIDEPGQGQRVRVPELVPFGEQGDDSGPGDGFFEGVGVAQLRVAAPCVCHSCRIVDGHDGPSFVEHACHVQCRRVPDIVGVGLECCSQARDLDAGNVSAGEFATRSTVRWRRRRLIASTCRRKETASPTPRVSARWANARMSLGRHPPPNPRPGFEEASADPGVIGQGPGQVTDVRAGCLADFSHRVDVGDLGGQEGVRGDLDQLGRGEVRGYHRGTCGDDGGVAGGQLLACPVGGDAEDRRSGSRVSLLAKPSRRNSGFQASSTRSPAGATAWTSRVR